jgi:hypothetical protein
MRKGETHSQRDARKKPIIEQKRPSSSDRKERIPTRNYAGSRPNISTFAPKSTAGIQQQRNRLVPKANDNKKKAVKTKASAIMPNKAKKSAEIGNSPNFTTEDSTRPSSAPMPTIRTRASSMIDKTKDKIKLAFNMNEKSTSSITRYWKKHTEVSLKGGTPQESLSALDPNNMAQNTERSQEMEDNSEFRTTYHAAKR